MKNILLILISSLFFGHFLSQTTIVKCSDLKGELYSNLLDENGNGNVPMYFGSIAFVNEKPYTGLVKDCYSNGSVREIHFRKNGVCDGVWTMYYENGKIYETIIYKNGLKEGETKAFYKSGSTQYISSYKNDKLDGKSNHYLENGILNFSLTYVNGNLISCDGNCKEYIDSYLSELEQRVITFIQLEEFEEAKLTLDRLLLLQNHNIKALSTRAYVYEKLADYNSAEKDYTTLIKLEPDNFQYYKERGMSYLISKNYSNSISDLTFAIKLNSNDKELFYFRALSKLFGKIEENTVCDDLKKSLSMGYEESREMIKKVCH